MSLEGWSLTSHPLTPKGQGVHRQVVTLGELAARLDKALYANDVNVTVEEGCRAAVRQGVAAVLVRPDQVDAAAAGVAGTGIAVVTALGWYDPDSHRLDVSAMKAEAQDLVRRGATEIAYVVTEPRLQHRAGQEVVDHITQLVQAVKPMGARVRTLIATEELSIDQIRHVCREVAAAGVWMVQGGSWRGRRTGLSRLEVIRDALPPRVLLKWTEPIKNLSTLLLCMSMGVDRFNGDVDQILVEARKAEWLAPLTIPIEGVDY